MKLSPKEAAIHTAIEKLQQLSEVFQHRRMQLAKQAGLTEQQWRVLEEISTEHFMPSMFAKTRESSAAAVSKIIRQLLDKQLVRVSIHHLDGRQRQYDLTSKGKKILNELRSYRTKAIETIWMDFELSDLINFNRFSMKLIDSIETFAEQEA